MDPNAKNTCAYCGCEVVEHDPRTIDDWETEAKQHSPIGCEWVETRAHTNVDGPARSIQGRVMRGL